MEKTNHKAQKHRPPPGKPNLVGKIPEKTPENSYSGFKKSLKIN